MSFTPDELAAALSQITSMISKLEKAMAGLTSPSIKSQRTLAERRIRALRIAETLIRKDLDEAEEG